MPFGIKSAPEVFQKTMEKFFSDLERVACYVDDLCIWSKTKRLNTVFAPAKECGLKFNESKYEFFKQEMSYLGHVLTKKGLKVDEKKVSAIRNMPTPQNKQDLMRFLAW
ncbi:retrovirus-related Pol polyprotein from [Elysia marginata]|uniref:Retrovirus-related Pol polyprotein from n=1 Tax=Elysia marginata TaxID=1093978 RepID=A0AAV4FUV1_9GAST|nr:retrovirus-related Pol polyprotein from [Elysia marginata]